jgi:hypothetical protein
LAFTKQTAFNLQLIAKHAEAQVLAVYKIKERKDIVDYQSKKIMTLLIFNEIRKMKELFPSF